MNDPAALLNEYELAVGKKSTSYYLEKFQLFDSLGRTSASWNWSAFFFNSTWALYRKMYGTFFITCALVILLPIFTSTNLIAPLLVCSMAFYGLYGNTIYHRHISKLIAISHIRHKSDPSTFKFLEQKGGVNQWLPAAIASVTALGIAAAVGIPAYQEHSRKQASAWTPPSTDKVIDFDPATAKQDAAENSLPTTYLQRVAALKAAAQSGRLAVIDGSLSETSRLGEKFWPANDVTNLENSQTWWSDTDFTYIHIVNLSQHNLSSFTFTYLNASCGSATATSEYTVQLSHFLAPKQEAIAAIRKTLGRGPGCLTITRAWG